ncbi:MAG: hypothetical protein K0S56_550 [Microvirga sp.]|jgi:hypothetical protein|nr:hypothetical protein [Microvirga sp.]
MSAVSSHAAISGETFVISESEKQKRDELRMRRAERIAPAARAEAKAIKKQKARIAARQSIGKAWDGKADNDNVNWPLVKALFAEGNHDLVKYAIRYRQIEASATSDAQLTGTTPTEGDYLVVAHETSYNGKGELVFGKVRRSLSAEAIGDIPPRQASRTGETIMHPSAPVAKKWSGDAKVNNMIDDKRLLARLRWRLGVIVEPFEELVLHGKTYEAVGRLMGIGNHAGAKGAACAMAHLGLIAVRDELGELRREDLAA